MKSQELLELLDVTILQQFQDAFSKYTGMAALTTDVDGVPVTVGSGFTDVCMNLTRTSELGAKRCEACDKQGALTTLNNNCATSYSCHAGLTDFAAPILLEGRVIGSIIGGQVRTGPIQEEKVRAIARELGIDEELYLEAYKKTAELPIERINKAAVFLAEIAAVLSEMAYNNRILLNHSKKLERTARSQTNYLIELNKTVEKQMVKWLEESTRALQRKDAKAIENALREITLQGTELVSAVQSVVEYARIAGGTIELKEVSYNIRELIEYIWENIKECTECGAIEFQLEIADNVPDTLLGDEGRLGQILTTMIRNAAQYTPKGMIRVEVNSIHVSYCDRLQIKVIDTGVGMDAVKLANVRDYINRGSLELLGSAEGRQLNFYIVLSLLRQMYGNMKVDSVEGEGSCFTIDLPQISVNKE